MLLTFGNVVRAAVLAAFCLAVVPNSIAQIPPAITAPPRSQTNWSGNNIILGVAVTGSEPFGYQWRFNDTPLAGQTNALLLLPMPTTNASGNFSVVVTNISGAVTSTPAALTIKSVTGKTTVVAWGDNGFGKTTVPAGLSEVTAIAAGGLHTVALKSDGTVVIWGDSSFGQTTVPAGLSGVMAVAAGHLHNAALKSDGTVVAWGNNFEGEVTGTPTTISPYVATANPITLGGQVLSGVVAIAAGWVHTVALKSDGTVIAWGDNHYGQTNVPAGLSGVTAIAAGEIHTVALKNDGTLVAWGSNNYGETTAPGGLGGVTSIAAGMEHTAALKGDGTVVVWGRNDWDQTNIPPGLSGLTAIAAGWGHTVALKSDDTVVAWGRNRDIYNNLSGQATVPIGLSGVTAIAAGELHSVAISTTADLPIRIHVDGVFVPSGTVVRDMQAKIGLYTSFTNATIFYSTNGTAPFIGGPRTYGSEFAVTNNTTIRALAVNLNDFSTAESEIITINILPPPPYYTLMLTAAGGGSVSPSPSASSYLSNSVVTITAVPNPGWTFLSWAGDVSGNNATNIITMDRAKSVQAIFGTTLNTSTPGNGSITKSPASGPYPFGSTVQLTASPTNGYYFVLWGGAASGSVNPLNYTVTTATSTVSALFLQAASSQTISFGPLSNRTLGDPPFTLNATASSGLSVSYSILSGPATVTGNTLTLTGGGTVVVRALQSGNASFSAAPSVDQSFTVFLTLTNPITGNGTVTRDPDLVQYTNGAVVQLTAVPGLQATFSGWTGSASGTTNPLSILMDANKSITANFLSTTNLLPPVFSLSSITYSVMENASTLAITVLKSASSLAGTVNFATADGSAHASSGGVGDYQAVSGTLNFLASDTSKTVTIPILDDPVYTGNRQFAFNLTLANLSDGSSLTNPSSATITITDDESPATTNSFLFHGNPGGVPAHNGQLKVSLEPPAANGQWRLAWETAWRNSGDLVGGLPNGNYEVAFKPVAGFIQPPNTTNPVSGSLYWTTNYYLQSGTPLNGSLSVNLVPPAANGQWRVQGETNWHNSGDIVANLSAGYQIVEFKSVTGYATPATRPVVIGADQINLIYATYLVANPSGSSLPGLLQFGDISQPLADQPPYPWCGQLLTEVGYGSGCVVKKRVVLTAAHVVFNDATLSFVPGVSWFFQRYQSAGNADDYEPAPQIPRGWYVLDGYAAARTNDSSPGVSSPTSQNLDIAALFFTEDAGRGGFSGYLVSNPGSTEWLQAAAPKTLIGYPVEGAGVFPGRMYSTTPGNRNFAPVINRVFSTTDILGYPGMSGGPLCVQFSTNGTSTYFPAGIFLGGSGQTIVRAIDGAAADLINRAEVTSYTGENNTGGGVITFIPSQNISSSTPGYLQVHLSPLAAVSAGAGWRLQGSTNYLNQNSSIVQITSTNAVLVEFKAVPGWNPPVNQTATIVPGQTTIYPAFYTVTNPVLVANGLGVGITGTTGTVYRIESRSSLTSGSWLPLTTNTILTSGFNLVLPSPATNGPTRFYRAVWLP